MLQFEFEGGKLCFHSLKKQFGIKISHIFQIFDIFKRNINADSEDLAQLKADHFYFVPFDKNESWIYDSSNGKPLETSACCAIEVHGDFLIDVIDDANLSFGVYSATCLEESIAGLCFSSHPTVFNFLQVIMFSLVYFILIYFDFVTEQ